MMTPEHKALVAELEKAAQWDYSPSQLLHEAIAAIESLSAQGEAAAGWPADGSCVRCGAVPRDPTSGLCATCVDEDTDFKDYDAGLLNDFGGGDVGWWQDYIRAEIGRANEFWREQVSNHPASAPVPDAVDESTPEEVARRDVADVMRVRGPEIRDKVAALASNKDGYVLVPKEPTLAMQNAGWREAEAQGIDINDVELAPIYRAMLAASGESGR